MGSRKGKDELAKSMKLMKIEKKPAHTAKEALNRQFEFWSTQPVPQMDEVVTANEPIVADVKTDDIRQEPYTLPDGFVWETLDLEDSSVLKELYCFLKENYGEDSQGCFRFDYPQEFLQWMLKPPGWKREWHCGVRVAKNKNLVGFISAVPVTIGVHGTILNVAETNFLCVHKKLRSKRVAPVLIREISRRVSLAGIYQSVYTAGVVLPKPIASCHYWCRSLNPKKLIETRFSCLRRNMTLQRTIKLFKLPEEAKCNLLRPLTKADVPGAHLLLKTYLEKFKLRPEFDENEFEYWLSPRKDVVATYIVEKDGQVTDMISYFALPLTVLNNSTHKSINTAYSFYNVATSMTLQELMSDALVLAKNEGFDAFNALDVMENKLFLENLKFGARDGSLQYYLFNWRCPSVSPSEIGLVLQ